MGVTILAIVLLVLLFLAIWKREAIRTKFDIFKEKRLNNLLKGEMRDEWNTTVKYEPQSSHCAVESSGEPGERTSTEANLEFVNFVATENFRSDGSTVDAYGS